MTITRLAQASFIGGLMNFIGIGTVTAQRNELGIWVSVMRLHKGDLPQVSNPFKYFLLQYHREFGKGFGLAIVFKPDLINGYSSSMTVRSMFDSRNLNLICERDGEIHLASITGGYSHSIKKYRFRTYLGFSAAKTRDFYLTGLVLAPPPPNGSGDVIFMDGFYKNAVYWGLPVNVTVSRLQFQKRLTINFGCTYTKFLGGFPSAFEVNFSGGFRF